MTMKLRLALPFPLCLVVLFAAGCGTDMAIDDLSHPPKVGLADHRWEGIFEPFEGSWRGTIRRYEDPSGQRDGEGYPVDFSREDIVSGRLRPVDSVLIEQTFSPLSRYFMRFVRRESRRRGDTLHTVVYRGAIKVQRGLLWRIVEETGGNVIHRGNALDPRTFTWQRDLHEPLEIEYFRLTIENDRCEVIGWGYYGQDDPMKVPRVWYWGSYERVAGSSGG